MINSMSRDKWVRIGREINEQFNVDRNEINSRFHEMTLYQLNIVLEKSAISSPLS